VLEQDNRRFYYFYNENFQETYVDEKSLRGKGLDMKLSHKVFKTFEWYTEHFCGMAEAIDHKEPIVYLLTNN
jgi:predicted GNAT family acetyltransferase